MPGWSGCTDSRCLEDGAWESTVTCEPERCAEVTDAHGAWEGEVSFLANYCPSGLGIAFSLISDQLLRLWCNSSWIWLDAFGGGSTRWCATRDTSLGTRLFGGGWAPDSVDPPVPSLYRAHSYLYKAYCPR